MTTHAEYAAGLRAAASFLESHPEIELPDPNLMCYRLYNKEVAAVTARAFSHGGRCEKEFSDQLVTLKRRFGAIELHYLGTRSNVCEQVRVGTRLVPERFIPPTPATEGHTVPEHEEVVYEWRCTPLLADRTTGVEMPQEPLALLHPEPKILEAEYVDFDF